MVRVQGFVAINEAQRGSSTEETQEARESRLIGLYESALRSLQRKEAADATAAFRSVLGDPLLQADGISQHLQRIRFLSLKNLGALLAEGGDHTDEALECYVSACELEANDVVLWNRLGTLAGEAGFWALARHAFERGLQCSPSHPTMRAKLQLLLRHIGDAHAAGPTAAGALGWAQPAAANAGALLRLPQLSAAQDQPVPSFGAAREVTKVKLSEASWAALLTSALSAASAKQRGPWAVKLALPAAKKLTPPGGGKAAGGADAHWAVMAAAAPAAAAGAAARAWGDTGHEVVRLQLTPGKARPSGNAEGAAREGGGASVAEDTCLAGAAAAAAAAAAGAEEHVAVELFIVRPQAETQGAAVAAAPQPAPGLPTPQQERPPGSQDQPAGAGETPATAPALQAALAADTGPRNGSISRGLRRRRSTARRHQAEPEPRTPQAPVQASLLSLVELLGAQPPAEQAEEPQQQQEAGAAGKAAGQDADCASAPLAAAAAAPAAEAAAEAVAAGAQKAPDAAAAVSDFVRALPAAGLYPTQLLLAATQRLAASPEAAAALSLQERELLVRAAERVQQEQDGARLPAACCLVLAEVCISDAARATASLAAAAGNEAARARGASGRARVRALQDPARRFSAAQLQQHAERWLLRCMAVDAMAGLEGGGSRGPYGSAHAIPGSAPAGEPGEGAAAGSPAAAAVAEGEGGTIVRYWWARGQLEEMRGSASEAALLYHRCLDALSDSGLPAVTLPHCPQPASADGAAGGPLAITPTAIRGKLEVLKLHDVVAEAEWQAQQGEHAAVADALAQFLLPCGPREASMAALDAQQWLHALARLRESGLACGRRWVAAACQLRLAWHVLAQLPAAVEVGGRQGHAAKGSAIAQAVRAALTQAAAAGLASALETSAHFFATHNPRLLAEGACQDDRSWTAWEWQLLSRVQRRLVGVLEGCRAALAGDATSSHLSLKASSLHRAMAAAAALTVHTWALNPAAWHSPAATASLLRPLCEALAAAHALMEGEGTFVLLCQSELRAAMQSLKAQFGDEVSEEEEEGDAEDVCSAKEVYWDLTCGLHSCLYWLYGIVLPGLEDDPWAEGYAAPSMAERLLSSPQACLDVWPLVKGDLLEMDSKELQAFEGFIRLVASHFPLPPPAALRRLDAAWAWLAERELPGDMLSGEIENPLEAPLPGASCALGGASGTGAAAAEGPEAGAEREQGAAQPMVVVDAPAAPAAGKALGEVAGSKEGQEQQQQQQQEEEEEEGEEFCAVRSSLYRLQASQQMDLQKALAGHSILSAEAAAELDRVLAPCKYDLLYNPCSFLAWEQLAASYHEAADWILEEAATRLTAQEWHSEAQSELRQRTRQYSHLGYHCTALALKYADSEEERAKLLAITANRIYSDLQQVPPFYDQLPSLPDTHPSPERQRATYERALRAFQAASLRHPGEWDLELAAARCLRRLQRPAAEWLPALAHACHLAAAHGGGTPLDAVYALHAARLKLVLSACSSVRSAGAKGTQAVEGGAAPGGDAAGGEPGQGSAGWSASEAAVATVGLVGRYCFLRESQQALAGWQQQRCHGTLAGSGAPGSGAQQGESGAEGTAEANEATSGLPAAPATAEAAASGDATMVDAAEVLQPAGGAPGAPAAGWPGGPATVEGALGLLLQDCLEAVKWCQAKDKQFHRATFRLAEAKLVTEGRAAALQELASLFSKTPKQPFCISATQIAGGDAGEAAAGGRKKKGGRSRRAQQQGEQTPQREPGVAPESDWGLRPARVAGVSQEESLQRYYGSVRKYLRRYLQLLSEEGQIDLLKAAGAFLASNATWGPAALPSFQDMRQLAGGQLVLCMLRFMRSLDPPDTLLSALEDLPRPAAQSVGAGDGDSQLADAVAQEGQGWDRVLPELRLFAQRLDMDAAEAGLEAVHQFWMEHRLQAKEEGAGWQLEVQRPAELALRANGLPPDSPEHAQLERSEELFRAGAHLYVLVLGRRSNWERLLALVKAVKQKLKGAQPSAAAAQHLELLFHEAHAALQQHVDALYEEAAAVRPELEMPPEPQVSIAGPGGLPAVQQAVAGPSPTMPAPALVAVAAPGVVAGLRSGLGAAAAEPMPRLELPSAPAVPPPLLSQPQQGRSAAAKHGKPEFKLLSQQGVEAVLGSLEPAERQRYEQYLASQGAEGARGLASRPAVGVAKAWGAGVVGQVSFGKAATAHLRVQELAWGRQEPAAAEEAAALLGAPAAAPAAAARGPPAQQQPRPSPQKQQVPNSPEMPETLSAVPQPQGAGVLQPLSLQQANRPAAAQANPACLSLSPPGLRLLPGGALPLMAQAASLNPMAFQAAMLRQLAGTLRPAAPAAFLSYFQDLAAQGLAGAPGAGGAFFLPAQLGAMPAALPVPMAYASLMAGPVAAGQPAQPMQVLARPVALAQHAAAANPPATAPAPATASLPASSALAAAGGAAAAGATTAAAQPVASAALAAPAAPQPKPQAPAAVMQQPPAQPPAAQPGRPAHAGPGSPAAAAGPRPAVEPPAVPPCPEPLTPEELELEERAIALLRGVRELQKAVHAAAQGSAYSSQTLHSLLRRLDGLLGRLFRAYAAISRSEAPPAGKVALQRRSDEAIKQHRRMSQKGPLASTAAAAASEPSAAGVGNAVTNGTGEGPGGKQGPAKRGRDSRAASRELASDGQEGAAAAGQGGVLGSARKRSRREAVASPSLKQQPTGASRGETAEGMTAPGPAAAAGGMSVGAPLGRSAPGPAGGTQQGAAGDAAEPHDAALGREAGGQLGAMLGAKRGMSAEQEADGAAGPSSSPQEPCAKRPCRASAGGDPCPAAASTAVEPAPAPQPAAQGQASGERMQPGFTPQPWPLRQQPPVAVRMLQHSPLPSP